MKLIVSERGDLTLNTNDARNDNLKEDAKFMRSLVVLFIHSCKDIDFDRVL